MEQILLAYGLLKETVATITIRRKNTRIKVHSPEGDTDFFDIVTGALQGDTLSLYIFILYLDFVPQTSLDFMKENGFTLESYYADDIELLANTPS